MKLVSRAGKLLLDVRWLYLLVGILASICAHEFIHIIMHFGAINSIHILPNLQTIIAIDVEFVAGYSLSTEEIVAYTVMALVQLVTIIDVLAIHDSRSSQSAEELIFGSRGQLSVAEGSRLQEIISR